MRSKVIRVLAVLFLSITVYGSPSYADTWVEAEGVIFAKTHNAVTGFTTLKILRPDGSKVNADCMINDAMTVLCLEAGLGNPANGRAFCTGGFCSWIELEISLGG